MRLELLGPGRLISPQGEVLLRSGLPLALLAYLHRSGGSAAREHLATLFWPGRTRPLALQSLRQAIRRLRLLGGGTMVVTEGRQVSAGALVTSCDVDDLVARVREGDASGALALWRGGFLDEFRLPRSWEVEDWLERERSGLSGTLLACVEAEVERLLATGQATEVAGLAEAARLRFPHREGPLRWQFQGLLATGRGAEASGVLEELRLLDEPSDMAELEARLREGLARPISREPTGPGNGEGYPGPGGDTPGADSGEGTDSGDEAGHGGRKRDDSQARTGADDARWGIGPGNEAASGSTSEAGTPAHPAGPFLRRLLPATLILAGLVMAAGGWWVSRPHPLDRLAEGLADWRLLYCHAAATGGLHEQPAWMDLAGRNKHRISVLHACSLVWVAGPGVLLAEEYPDTPEGEVGLVIIEPLRENPIAEWVHRPAAATAGLRGVELMRRGSVVLDGHLVALTGIDSTGVRRLYLLDVTADTIRALTHGPGDVRYPTFDLARKEVVFSREREGPAWDLWALSVDTPDAEPVRLTVSPSEDSRASVHDGRVLFVRGWGEGPTEGDMEIRLLHRGTGREEVLTSNPWNEYEAVWSPDGRRICWQSDEFGHFESDIHVMELSSRRTWPVTRDRPSRNAGCMWTPDGRGLLYHGTEEGVTQAILTDPRGRLHRNLSRDGHLSAPVGFIPAPERWSEGH